MINVTNILKNDLDKKVVQPIHIYGSKYNIPTYTMQKTHKPENTFSSAKLCEKH